MKKLLILSGKGGTGKTTIASGFIKLANAKAFADCDVDAPNLHLVINQKKQPQKTNYYGMGKAKINTNGCIGCGLCAINCAFDAIKKNKSDYAVNGLACEGCGVCEAICPTEAIKIQPDIAGELMLYKDNYIFSTAKLKMGSGTSGKLVTEVKKQLNKSDIETDIAIIDGSPGIGCPVIASISGMDMILIVTEPSLSGISDMKRIINTTQIFQTTIAVCINKYDTNLENTKKIQQLCKDLNIDYVGQIPYDIEAINAINNGKSIIETNCNAKKSLEKIFNKTIKILYNI